MLLRNFLLNSIMLLLICANDANGQNLDSMENVLVHESTDTTTLKKYLKKIDALTNDQIALKETIGNWIIEKSNSKEKLRINASAYQILARCYLRTGDFKKATGFYNKAILISENNNYYETLCLSLNGLAGVYRQSDQKETARTYYIKSLALSQKHNFQDGIAINKFELGGFVKVLKIPSKVESINVDSLNKKFKLFTEAIQIWENLKDTQRLIKSNIQCSESFANYELFDSAFSRLQKAADLLSNKNYNRYFLDYYFIAGKVYVRKAESNDNNKEDLLKAIDYFNLSFPYAIKYNEVQYRMWNYSWLSTSYEKLNDYKTAYHYRLLYDDLDDSLTGEVNFKQIADVQHKYDREKKEKEVLQIKVESNKKTVLNYILIGGTIPLSLIGLLGYRHFRAKQKLQQQKFFELEKDKQLHAIDAMLKGQEEERSRIAKDLHDGLGGMLSGVKLSFVNMKENMIMDADSVISFENSIKQLDNTITELRKVAHNLMPEALVKFGLNNAVTDFCNAMQLASKIKIIFEPMGIERQLTNTADLYVYRIIQELINNALKHAAPNQILVQFTKTPDKILLTVEDDGKGFNKEILASAKGIGMKNLQQRIDYFKGKMELVTKPGEGTSVHIELIA